MNTDPSGSKSMAFIVSFTIQVIVLHKIQPEHDLIKLKCHCGIGSSLARNDTVIGDTKWKTCNRNLCPYTLMLSGSFECAIPFKISRNYIFFLLQ